MRLSAREMVLAWLTMVAVVGGVTYWIVSPKVKESKEAGREMNALSRRMPLVAPAGASCGSGYADGL